MKKTNFKWNAMHNLFNRTSNIYKWTLFSLTGMVMLTACIVLFFLDKDQVRQYQPLTDFIICCWLGYMVISCVFLCIIEAIFNRS